MISFTGIQKGLVKTINTLVGKDAPLARQLFTSPVVRAKQKGSLGSFPLVIVDKLGTGQYGISSVSDVYYNELEQLTRETRYKASYIVDVHGDIEDEVEMIAQVIRDTLFTPYGIELLGTNTGAGLLAISSPSFSFKYLNTDYEEVSRITIDFSVTDITVEESDLTGEITSIIVDGELFDSAEDVSPLPTHSVAP